MSMVVGMETRQLFLENEVGVLKDTVWRLTGRIYVLESFIKKKFGEALELSALYSQTAQQENSTGNIGNSQLEINNSGKRKHAFPENSYYRNESSKIQKVSGTSDFSNHLNANTNSTEKCTNAQTFQNGRRSQRGRTVKLRSYRERSDSEWSCEEGADDADGSENELSGKTLPKIEIDDECYSIGGGSEDNFRDLGDYHQQKETVNEIGNDKSNISQNIKTPSSSDNLAQSATDVRKEHLGIPKRKKEKVYQKYSGLKSTPEDEAFRMTLPPYFKKFLQSFQCHDLFPSNANYEYLKTVLKLPKGQAMEGLDSSKKLRIHARFEIKEINGEEVLISRKFRRQILKQSQFFDAMKSCHEEQGHPGRDATVKIVRGTYACVPNQLISAFIKNCDDCNSRRATIKQKQQAETHVST